MFKTLKKAFRGRPAAKAAARQARPQVEALDGRLLPSSVPILTGLTLNFGSGRSLQVLSEQDNGNGTGAIQGYYYGNYGSAFVAGGISLKSSSGGWSDFGISYGGSGASYYGGVDIVNGGGDFYTNYVSDTSYYYANQDSSVRWNYSGSSTEVFNTMYGDWYGASHTDQVIFFYPV
jgi:hypothetical protein